MYGEKGISIQEAGGSMLRKYFDWTPSDIAEWEKLRAKGLGRFVLWYGIKLFAGWLFLLVAAGVLFFWIKAALQTHSANFTALMLQLLLACRPGPFSYIQHIGIGHVLQ